MVAHQSSWGGCCSPLETLSIPLLSLTHSVLANWRTPVYGDSQGFSSLIRFSDVAGLT